MTDNNKRKYDKREELGMTDINTAIQTEVQ
jgi:hypothetical protein